MIQILKWFVSGPINGKKTISIEVRGTIEVDNTNQVSSLFCTIEHWLLNCSVICKLRNGPLSPRSLCGSVVEHQNAESKGLKFDSLWRIRIFSLSHAREKTKSIFLFSEMFQKAIVWFINCTLFSSLN